MKIVFLAICLLLCACAVQRVEPTAPEEERDFFVVLPGNYIIDLAAGSEVVLNPGLDEFVLFTTPQAAQAALRHELNIKNLDSKADWRVYRLHGKFAELTRRCRGNQLCLAKSAVVEDWVENTD